MPKKKVTDSMPIPEAELERYGVWVKTEPQDIIEDVEDSDFGIEDTPLDLPDIDEALASDDEFGTWDSLDLPEESDSEIDDIADISLADESFSDFEDSADISESAQEDDFIDLPLNELETETVQIAEEPKQTVKAITTDEISFETTELSLDDFDMVDELTPEVESFSAEADSDSSNDFEILDMDLEFEDTIPVAEQAPKNDFSQNSAVSSELLQSIAMELASIKQELVSLRSQISGIKADAISEPVIAAAESHEAKESSAGGFFDDEDDDTIALTGDELNNILHSADFTEETILESETLDTQIDAPELDETSIEIEEDVILEEETETSPIMDELADSFEETILPEDGDYSSSAGIEMIEISLSEPEPQDDTVETELSSFMDSPLEEELSETVEFEPEIILNIEEPEIQDSEDLIQLEIDEVPVMEEDSFDEIIVEETTSEFELGDAIVEEELPDEIEFEISETIVEEELPDTIAFDISDAIVEEELPDVTDFDIIETIVEVPDATDFEISETIVKEELPDTSEDTSEFELSETIVEEKVSETVSQVTEITPKAPDSKTDAKLKQDVRSVLLYLDQLLAALPDEKIEEFASSEYYETYKKLFDELGIL